MTSLPSHIDEQDLVNANHDIDPKQLGADKPKAPTTEYEAHKDVGAKRDRQNEKQEAYQEAVKTGKKSKPAKEWLTADMIEDWGVEQLKGNYGEVELLKNTKATLGAKISIGFGELIPKELGIHTPGSQYILRSQSKPTRELIGIFKKAININGEKDQYIDEWLRVVQGQKAALLSSWFEAIEMPKAKSVSITGKHTAFKRVYPLDWFSDKIQSFDCSRLLPIFNEAEKDTFMLHMGRTVAGAKYELDDEKTETARTIESFEDFVTEKVDPKYFDHTYRSIAILSGNAGTGKSTLLGAIQEAMKTTGYTATTLALSGNQFNWGVAGKVDMLFSDDLSKTDFAKLYKNSQMKTIATNGKFSDEDKSIIATMARSITTITLCCNDTNIDDYTYDEGNESRYHNLQTKEPNQVTQELGCEYKDYLNKLAKEHGCTVNTLFVYFLRRCLDKFIAACGYEWDATLGKAGAFKIVHPSKLKEIAEFNKSRYTAPITVNLQHEVTKASRKVHVINDWIMGMHRKAGRSVIEMNPNTEADMKFDIMNIHQLQNFMAHLVGLENDCRVSINSNEIKPGYENLYKQLKAAHNWILDERIFPAAENAGAWSTRQQFLIDKPYSTEMELWYTGKVGFKSVATCGRGHLDKSPKNYLTGFLRAKATQSAFATEWESMVEGFDDGMLFKLQKIKCQYQYLGYTSIEAKDLAKNLITVV